MIRNGYIDETYPDYMTYFYEDSVSRIDKTFLRSVADKKAKEPTYELKNPKLVLSRLGPTDFDQEETLNNNLADYLIHNANDSEELAHLVEQLKNSKRYAFVEQFLEKTTDLPALVILLGKEWPEFFAEVYLGERISSDHVRQFSVNCLNYLDNETLSLVNRGGILCKYISSASDYLAIENPNVDKLINGFNALSVAFSQIDYKVANKDLFQAVYESGNYEINIQNIQQMLVVCYQLSEEDDFQHKTTTLILQKPDSPLAKKIFGNTDTYLSIILDACDGIICDDQAAVLEILNSDAIQDEQKETYIDYLQTILSDIALVYDQDLWGKIVENKLVVCSERNIVAYYNYVEGLDDPSISWINSSPRALDFSVLDDADLTNKRKLFEDFVKSLDLGNNVYEQAVTSLGEHFDKFDIAGITNDKVQILIHHGIIQMNGSSLIFIRRRYPEIKDYFIQQNIKEYVEIMDDELFDFDELLSVLAMNVEDADKLSLLQWTTRAISIRNEHYSSGIQEYILQHNLHSDDPRFLYENYSTLDTNLKGITENLAIDRMKDIISNPNSVDCKLKDTLMRSQDVALEQKIELLIADLPNLLLEDVLTYLPIVEKEKFKKVFEPNARPKYEDTRTNRNLLQGFIDKGWIREYYVEGGYLKIHRQSQR